MRRVVTGIITCLVLALATGVASADGLIVIHDPPILPHPNPPPPHGHPRPRPHYRFAPLEVQYHHVSTRITVQVATTEVDQSFFNPNNQQLEGTYIFPIPAGAGLDQFSMDINGKLVEAELLDADKARKVYEDIVRKARDPALLEYSGQGMLRARIFPIEPHSEKRVRLKYTQLLRSDAGTVQYLYPLNTEKFSAAPIKSVSIKIELECKQGIKSLYSPSHAVEIKRRGDTSAVVGYEVKNARPDTDFQLLYSTGGGADVGLSLLTFNDADSEGGYFLLLASPAGQLAGDKLVAKDVVFVLDTSGSMSEGNKLDQAKRALRFCLKNLNSADRFELVRFSTESQALFGELVPVNSPNVSKAESFVDELKPIGGTAIQDALLTALKPAQTQGSRDRPYFVVFHTDGQPTVGNTNIDAITDSVTRAMGDRTIRVFCFGLGTDVNAHLLDRLADNTRAASQYVLPNEDIELKVSSFYSKINQPVLANLGLRCGGDVRLSKMYPSDLPDLFAGEQLTVFGRYSGEGSVAITLDGVVNGEKRSFTYDARFDRRASSNAFIPRLWATRRVGYLLDEIRLRGESRELRDEVTALARKYGIVTPYTAYLIVEDEKQRNIHVSRRTLQEIDRDDELRAESERAYDGAKKEAGGGRGVSSSEGIRELKAASGSGAPAQAARKARPARFGVVESPAESRFQSAVESQETRHIRGRSFYQNGEQWIDAGVQDRANARTIQVKFDSDDYYALLTRYPDAAQWLSLGRNVQLVLDDTIYEIVE